MDPDKRYHLPTIVMPGLAGVALNPNYLTLWKQKSVSDKFSAAIRTELERSDYEGCSITPEMLEFETDFALIQLRAAARLHLPREPDRRHLLSTIKVPASYFQGSYDMHWDDLVGSVCSTSAQRYRNNSFMAG